MTTITAKIGNTEWSLTGIESSTAGTTCDHCGRKLKNLYNVCNDTTGQIMTIGRGCCKRVTGWTLTAAQAAHKLRFAEAQARENATWDTFTAAHPGLAGRIQTGASAEIARGGSGGGQICQLRRYIRQGVIRPERWAMSAQTILREYA